jgi:hypothetical protein
MGVSEDGILKREWYGESDDAEKYVAERTIARLTSTGPLYTCLG